MKLNSTRVNETIDFISNNNNYPPVRRQAVAHFCRQTYPRLSLLDFGPYRNEFEALAGEMSVKQHATVPAGNRDERARRRAILLIWKSIGKTFAAGNAAAAQAAMAMTMPTGNLDAALADAIMKASVCASPAAAADVFTGEVIVHPRRFLATHKVIVLGLTTGANKFTNLAGADYSNVMNFHFQYDPGNNRFVFNGNPNPAYGAAHAFATVSVPAVNWYDVPGNGGEQAPLVPANFAQILGCQLTGANFMVTTQFTGCTFCWTTTGIVRAAHIGPTKAGYPNAALATSYPGGGNGVAQRMINQGNPAPAGIGVPAGMANAPGAALRVFGRGAGNAPAVAGGNPFYPNLSLQYATIIGRNVAGGWRFYLQAIDSVTGQISEARRIL